MYYNLYTTSLLEYKCQLPAARAPSTAHFYFLRWVHSNLQARPGDWTILCMYTYKIFMFTLQNLSLTHPGCFTWILVSRNLQRFCLPLCQKLNRRNGFSRSQVPLLLGCVAKGGPAQKLWRCALIAWNIVLDKIWSHRGGKTTRFWRREVYRDALVEDLTLNFINPLDSPRSEQ